MNTERLADAGTKLDEIWQQVFAHLQTLSDPVRQRRLKQGLVAVASVWMVFALVSLVWSLVPAPDAPATPGNIINPLVEAAAPSGRKPVNIDEMAGWSLFGTAASTPAADLPQPEAVTVEQDGLEGIENNAQETRLALKLQGIVASSDPDLARAIIEAKREQAQYAIGDELPINNRVKLAKILSDRVVIDNAGKYELLLLFDENDFKLTPSGSESAQTAAAKKPAMNSARRLDRRGNQDVTEMAENYRRRLYNNPQSLAQVVNIAAVREEGQLKGYRVSAGRDSEQFAAMGFQANDIVTGVNGIQLSDPGKAMELYRVMRTASEASFDVLRDGQQVTVVVGLGEAQAGQPSVNPGNSRAPTR
ncbi:MAG: type II secretion system protein GspC [Halieaceae bacterium]|nr:type II secretion system protein GspC [Halieaceae bacterium]